MDWKSRIGKITSKAKELNRKAKKMVNTEKAKELKARTKKEIKNAERLATDLRNADKRLGELKSMDAIEKKREEITRLEKRVTTKGKLLTGLESAVRTGIKMAKDEHKRATRAQHRTRPRKPKIRGKGRK